MDNHLNTNTNSATSSNEPETAWKPTDGVMTAAQYCAAGGTRCPACGSTDISGDSVEIEAGTASQEISCSDCGSSWTDTYKLTGWVPEEMVDQTTEV